MGVAYALHPKPGIESSAVATKKWMVDASGKVVMKKAKIEPTKKASMVKIIGLKPKSGMKGCLRKS
jgi:hypothetical protein